MAALNVRELGDYIRDQRRTAQISLRQLAKQAGVSNPYLSQIERGLRKPSAEILQQIAKALRISAEVLYVQAGILEEREGGENLHAAVLADEFLTPRQKQVILDIYDAFRRENAVAAAAAADDGAGETSGVAVEEPGTAAETPGSRPPTTDGAEAAEAAAPGTRAIPKPAAAEAAAPAAGRTTTTGRPRRASASSGTPAAAARTTGRRPRATATGETAAAKPARRAATRRATTRRPAADAPTDGAGAAAGGPGGVGEESSGKASPTTAPQP